MFDVDGMQGITYVAWGGGGGGEGGRASARSGLGAGSEHARRRAHWHGDAEVSQGLNCVAEASSFAKRTPMLSCKNKLISHSLFLMVRARFCVTGPTSAP